jgi:hypothetical protein
MERSSHPVISAQEETAAWWLGELRAELDAAPRTAEEVQEIVYRHADRIDETLLKSAYDRSGVPLLRRRERIERDLSILGALVAGEQYRVGAA